MITLTSAIAIPNLTRVRLRQPLFDDINSVLTAQIEVGTAAGGGKIYATLMLEVRNGGNSNGMRAKASPTSFADFVEGFTLGAPLATGFDDALTAFAGGGAGLAAKLRALETWAQGVGLLPAGAVS